MKKTLLFALVLGSFFCLKAQEGDILYTDFEPDLCVSTYSSQTPHDTTYVDFDNDGMIDLKVYHIMLSAGGLYPFIETTWRYRIHAYENDTILPAETWHSGGTLLRSTDAMIGFKKTINDLDYYVWTRIWAERTGNMTNYTAYVCVDRYAYCTIPDYPLHWGQTSLNWSVEENTEVSTSIHPNPATDFITIDLPNEEDCQSIEIFSIYGRLVVETFPETSHQTTIDISGLNTGMYIMKIKLSDGREFAEKIVKE